MTTISPSRPTGAPAGTPGWRYRPDGGRDRRLDLLRGFALFAMSVNHLGLSHSLFHHVSGRSAFLISAAEVFLFVSGFTLGWVSLDRPPGAAEDRLWRRSWILYLATSGVTLGMILVALHTDLTLWAGFEAGELAGPADALAQVATLRLAVGGTDILVAYVLYLLAAVAALRAMARGRSLVVAAAVGGLYLASQVAPPEAFRLPFASFRTLVPSAPLFFGGLLLGYHRREVGAAWRRLPGHRWLDVAGLGLAAVLGVLQARGWQDWPRLGDLITAGNPEEPLWVREEAMPFWPLATVALYLRAGWLVVDRAWRPLERFGGRLLLPLGEAALFTFVAHLVAIPIFANLPGHPLDRPSSTLAATAWVAAYLGSILAAVHGRRRVLAWLRAGTPDHNPARAWIRANGPAVTVAVLALAVLASTNPTGQAGPWGDHDRFDDEELEDGGFEDEALDGAHLEGGEPEGGDAGVELPQSQNSTRVS